MLKQVLTIVALFAVSATLHFWPVPKAASAGEPGMACGPVAPIQACPPGFMASPPMCEPDPGFCRSVSEERCITSGVLAESTPCHPCAETSVVDASCTPAVSPTSIPVTPVNMNDRCTPWFVKSNCCQELLGHPGAYRCCGCPTDCCDRKPHEEDCCNFVTRFVDHAAAVAYCRAINKDVDCLLCVKEPYICYGKPEPVDVVVHECEQRHRKSCKEECRDGCCTITESCITTRKLEPCSYQVLLQKEYIKYDNVYICLECKCPPGYGAGQQVVDDCTCE